LYKTPRRIDSEQKGKQKKTSFYDWDWIDGGGGKDETKLETFKGKNIQYYAQNFCNCCKNIFLHVICFYGRLYGSQR
jgi:hypothetical protein